MSLKQDSIFLSLLLRHKPQELKLDMDNQGYVSVQQLIENSNGRFTSEKLQEIVKIEHERKTKDAKDRYSFNEDGTKIRANQGHSIKGLDLGLEFVTPPKILYHGTAKHSLESIMEKGILCGCKYSARDDVHLSSDKGTAHNVGSRHVIEGGHDYPVILEVDTERMNADGYKFRLSKNGVWLTKDIPPVYLTEI